MEVLITAFLAECKHQKDELCTLAEQNAQMIRAFGSGIDVSAWDGCRCNFAKRVRQCERLGLEQLERSCGRKRQRWETETRWKLVCNHAILTMNSINTGATSECVKLRADAIIQELIDQIKKIKYKEMEY